jgi:hypothetical protein
VGGILNDIGAVSTSQNYSNASVLLRITIDYASVEYSTNIIEYFKAKHSCAVPKNKPHIDHRDDPTQIISSSCVEVQDSLEFVIEYKPSSNVVTFPFENVLPTQKSGKCSYSKIVTPRGGFAFQPQRRTCCGLVVIEAGTFRGDVSIGA